MKKPVNFLVICSLILLVIIAFHLDNKAELGAEVLQQIELNRSKSESEKDKRQYLILIMFQQTGLVFTLILLPIGFSVYQNRSAFNRYRRKFIKVFNRKTFTNPKSLAERLILAYPQLTANDLNLCDLVYKGLSAKEIAINLNISPSSVNTARYRLRKKLNIPSDEELITFLYKI